MSSYANIPGPNRDRSFGPLPAILFLLVLVAGGGLLGLLAARGSLSLPGSAAPTATAAPVASTDPITSHPEASLTYPGAIDPQQAVKPYTSLSDTNTIRGLLGQLDPSAQVTTAAMTYAVQGVGGPTITGWYTSYLTAHGWRSCHGASAAGISSQLYARAPGEAFLTFDADGLGLGAAASGAGHSATVVMFSAYITSPNATLIHNC